MSKRLAFICGCLLFLGGPILALSPNDPRNKLVEILQPSLVAASPYRVDGLALGNQVRFGQQARNMLFRLETAKSNENA